MNLTGIRKDVDRLKQSVESQHAVWLRTATDELLAAGRFFGLPEIERGSAEKLVELVAANRESIDPYQILVNAGYTPEQASEQVAAQMQEFQAYFEARG